LMVARSRRSFGCGACLPPVSDGSKTTVARAIMALTMFHLYVVLDQPKNWLEYAPPWITAVAALITVVVAGWIARNQRKLQMTLAERLLKKDLFDRRFKVFTDAAEFMRPILASPSAFDPLSDEGRRFAETVQSAEMVFGPEVFEYLNDVNKTAIGLWASHQKMAKDRGDNDAITENADRFQHLSDLWQKRSEAFRRDLSLG